MLFCLKCKVGCEITGDYFLKIFEGNYLLRLRMIEVLGLCFVLEPGQKVFCVMVSCWLVSIDTEIVVLLPHDMVCDQIMALWKSIPKVLFKAPVFDAVFWVLVLKIDPVLFTLPLFISVAISVFFV